MAPMADETPTLISHPSVCHIFQPPLRVSMLRKIHYRIQQPLNYSQNCARTLLHEHITKQSASVIDINEDNYQRALNQCSPIEKWKPDNRSHACRSFITMTNIDSSRSNYSHCCCRKRTHLGRYLSHVIHKQESESRIRSHHHRHATRSCHCLTTSHNTNSVQHSPPHSTDSTINIATSITETSNPLDKATDKTWRLKIHDHLNKDGSRHFVMHKGTEESIRKRRESKRAKRSEEKKQKINEKISRANQRWQKYSNIDYELVFFISRYYDRLPLCATCRNFFTTHQTHFLSDDPRASIDYAADTALRSTSHKTITVKEAAKARLIQDYDKQTDLIFHLCDACLSKCEEIRNELKQISAARKTSATASPHLSPLPTMFVSDEPSPSPSTFSPISSPAVPLLSTNQPQASLTPSQNVNHLLDYHRMKLQQLYEQSQHLIAARQHQEQIHEDLESCIRQMQDHRLELLRIQYPGAPLTFPYIPSSESADLTYRHQEMNDGSGESGSDASTDEDDREDESESSSDTKKWCECNTDGEELSQDDRLRIKTCNGLVEYCNTPLDDFIRGLQVLKCLGTFNRFAT